MITPRERFKVRAKAAGWHWQDVVDSEVFQEAAQAALLEMELYNSHAPDMGSAAAFHWRGEGAKQFLNTLMGLVDSAPPVKAPVRQNLNHNA